MAAFPNFAPSQRSFKPGIYPQRSYRSLSGVVTKRTFGNSPSQATLEMSFDNPTEALLISRLNTWLIAIGRSNLQVVEQNANLNVKR